MFSMQGSGNYGMKVQALILKLDSCLFTQGSAGLHLSVGKLRKVTVYQVRD